MSSVSAKNQAIKRVETRVANLRRELAVCDVGMDFDNLMSLAPAQMDSLSKVLGKMAKLKPRMVELEIIDGSSVPVPAPKQETVAPFDIEAFKAEFKREIIEDVKAMIDNDTTVLDAVVSTQAEFKREIIEDVKAMIDNDTTFIDAVVSTQAEPEPAAIEEEKEPRTTKAELKKKAVEAKKTKRRSSD